MQGQITETNHFSLIKKKAFTWEGSGSSHNSNRRSLTDSTSSCWFNHNKQRNYGPNLLTSGTVPTSAVSRSRGTGRMLSWSHKGWTTGTQPQCNTAPLQNATSGCFSCSLSLNIQIQRSKLKYYTGKPRKNNWPQKHQLWIHREQFVTNRQRWT